MFCNRETKNRTALIVLVVLVGLAQTAFAQWSNDPNFSAPICTTVNEKSTVSAVSDGAGGIIAVWKERWGTRYEIFVQRLNSAGLRLWIPDGVQISHSSGYGVTYEAGLVSDGLGGAIIAWFQRDTTVECVHLQRINGLGELLWGSDGVQLFGAQAHGGLQVVSDGAGGVILAYTQGITAYAQRVNSVGVIQWEAGGVPLSTTPGSQWYPNVISDGAGGAIAVWYGGVYPTFDIYAQRVNGNGVVLWSSGGAPIAVAPGAQTSPVIASDGMGGAFMAWRDQRGGAASIYAQRINGSGVAQWIANGIGVTPTAYWKNSYSLVADGSDGMVISWEENSNLLAQKLSGSGVAAWPTNGIEIAHGVFSGPKATTLSDGVGGFVTIWDQMVAGKYDIYAQRISAAGVLLWGLNGVPVSTNALYDNHFTPVLDGRGGIIVPWILRDPNGGMGLAVYAQRLNLDGTLGASSIIANGGFEQGLSSWSGGGCVTPSIVTSGCSSTNAAKVLINGANCNAQFYQHGFVIERGKRYRVKFQAWSSRGEDMQLTVLPHNASTPNIGLDRRVDLGTTPCANYQFEFVATGSTNDARLRFYFNYMSTTGYWYAFDNVSIEQIMPKQGEPEIAIPTSYALDQNFPNPFNPSTNISFTIPNDGNVSLKVFDLLGREVASLVNEARTAGSYTETFDASRLSSGTYFYKLESESFVQTKKFVLLR